MLVTQAVHTVAFNGRGPSAGGRGLLPGRFRGVMGR
jgi:hypothetical protein